MKGLVLLLAALLLPAAASGADAGGERIFTGIYTSEYQDRPASLRAIFSPQGDEQWSVVFHFTHAGARHAYRGTAWGDLSSGELIGRVQNEGRNRLFAFRCEFDGVKCEGTHAEIGRGGREQETGRLTLKGLKGR